MASEVTVELRWHKCDGRLFIRAEDVAFVLLTIGERANALTIMERIREFEDIEEFANREAK